MTMTASNGHESTGNEALGGAIRRELTALGACVPAVGNSWQLLRSASGEGQLVDATGTKKLSGMCNKDWYMSCLKPRLLAT